MIFWIVLVIVFLVSIGITLAIEDQEIPFNGDDYPFII